MPRELKPEVVTKALAWYEVVGKNVGSVTLPYDELKAITALLREKDARIKELEEAVGAEFTCFVGEPNKVDRCPYGDELARLQKEVAEKDAEIERLNDTLADALVRAEVAKVETITEFFERVCKEVEQTPNANEFFINAWKEKFEEIAKEMKGEAE